MGIFSCFSGGSVREPLPPQPPPPTPPATELSEVDPNKTRRSRSGRSRRSKAEGDPGRTSRSKSRHSRSQAPEGESSQKPEQAPAPAPEDAEEEEEEEEGPGVAALQEVIKQALKASGPGAYEAVAALGPSRPIVPKPERQQAAHKSASAALGMPPKRPGQGNYATAPSPGIPGYPSTFDVLGKGVRFPIGRPEDLQSLRASRRSLQVCKSPAEMLSDLDHLTYISRGATSVVFHGIWQGADVAIKLLLSNFNDHSASVREALLGAEISHPNVVHLFLARCCTLTPEFLVYNMDGITLPMSQHALASTSPAPLPKSLYRTTFDSGDGFGPPPSCKLMMRMAEDKTLASAPNPPASAAAAAATAAGRANYSPWGGQLTWGHVLTFLNALPGQVLTMVVAEYCDVGTLSSAIHERMVFDMSTAVFQPERHRLALRALLRTARETAMGLHHLHLSGIIHGDVKPGNVLLISTRTDRRGFMAKLTDLGAARVLPQHPQHGALGSRPSAFGVGNQDSNFTSVVGDVDWGTTPYMAPEHLAGFLVPASDIFSLGVTLWEMCHGRRPYENLTHAAVSEGVVSGDLKLTWSAPVPASLIDLVGKCLLHSPASRPNTAQVLCKLASIEANIRTEMRSQALLMHQARLAPPVEPQSAPGAEGEPLYPTEEALEVTQLAQQQLLIALQRQIEQQRVLLKQLQEASGQQDSQPQAGTSADGAGPSTSQAGGFEAGPSISQADGSGADASTSQAGTSAGQAGPSSSLAGTSSAQAGPSGPQVGTSSAQAGPSGPQVGTSSAQAGPSSTQAGTSSSQAGPSSAQAGTSNCGAGPSAAQAGTSNSGAGPSAQAGTSNSGAGPSTSQAGGQEAGLSISPAAGQVAGPSHSTGGVSEAGPSTSQARA